MIPIEKAQELVDTYRNTIMSFLSDNMKDMNAKKCALIAVDEILAEHFGDDSDYGTRRYNFFTEVKSEINNL